MRTSLVFDVDKLRERVDEVNPIDAKETVRLLIAKMKKYPELYALAAPQIGIKERVIVLKYEGDNFKEYINPRIFKAQKYHLVREKDISIPDKEFISPRPGKIFIEYQNQYAAPETDVMRGNSAEIFDRMVNYLDGITLEDYGLEVIEGFDEASDEEKQEIIDLYLKSLKTRSEILNDNIEHDKDAKELVDAIEFMKEVDQGKVKLEPVEEREDAIKPIPLEEQERLAEEKKAEKKGEN